MTLFWRFWASLSLFLFYFIYLIARYVHSFFCSNTFVLQFYLGERRSVRLTKICLAFFILLFFFKFIYFLFYFTDNYNDDDDNTLIN